MIDNIEKYSQHSANLEKEVLSNKNGIIENEVYKPYYLFTRANKFHFLYKKGEDYRKFYLQNFFYKSLGENLDYKGVTQKALSQIINVNNESREILVNASTQNKPRIYCSFHIGGYHLLGYYLAQLCGKISVVLRKSPAAVKKISRLSKEAGYSVNILDAEDLKVGFKIIKELEKGNSIFVLLDWNNEVGKLNFTTDMFERVCFLNKKIYVKKGVAAISRIYNIPIVPIISYRTETGVVAEVKEEIIPSNDIPRSEYIKETLQSLYAFLEEFVKKYPEQWEGWPYIHRFIDFESFVPRKDRNIDPKKICVDAYTFNDHRYGVFKSKEGFILLDKNTYKVFVITEGLFNVLSTPGIIAPDSLKASLTDDLISNGVLL